uniref:VWFA domain-containing protein n=1 Tax=Ascaris lumbricoides TaxID=6252 RepID=A0A0M3IVS2_ASCLU
MIDVRSSNAVYSEAIMKYGTATANNNSFITHHFNIASMILYLLIQLIYGTGSTVIASKCDLGAADVMFVVQSSYDISNDDFEDVKNFLKQYVDDLDIGFHEKVSISES